MGKITGVSYAHHTFTIAEGCQKLSPGCAHCYAERDAKRYGRLQYWGRPREASESHVR